MVLSFGKMKTTTPVIFVVVCILSVGCHHHRNSERDIMPPYENNGRYHDKQGSAWKNARYGKEDSPFVYPRVYRIL